MKVALVGIFRNEEDVLEEWVEYHSRVGFQNFYLYDNASTDRSAEVVSGLTSKYNLELTSWPMTGQHYQTSAYEDAVQRFGKGADWMAFFDLDEFFVAVRDKTVTSFLESLNNHSAVALNWAMFGSSGHIISPAGPVTKNYVHRAPDDFAPNRHVKMILRPSCLIKFENAHVAELNCPIVSALGRPMQWERSGLSIDLPGFEVAHLNHYFTKSRDAWEAKIRRGYSDDLQRDLSEFEIYDRNEIPDGHAASVL